MWVSECLQGKYKGLEKAARIYTAALEQPMYFRLVILELMENLTSGDQAMRRNSLWMLSKLVEERFDYSFMSPTIQILISSIEEKNQAIRYYALKVINQIASNYYDQFKTALPQIVNSLRDSSSKIKSLAAAIVSQFIEVESNAMADAIKYLVKVLKDGDLEIREVAIRGLLRINQHVDEVVQSIMESFDDEQFRDNMIRYIFEFIKQNPISVIEALRKTVTNKDDQVRENSIIFLHQLAESKNVSELANVVPELIRALNDKSQSIRRTSTRILYLISKENAKSLFKGSDKFIQFLKIKNRQLLTYFIYILVQLLKFFPDELSNQVDSLIKLLEKTREWEDVEPDIEIINAISLCTLYRYENQVALALNLAQDCVRKYRHNRNIYELHLFIGYTHYYLGDHSDSIQAFLKAESAQNREDFYTATLATIMIALNFALLRTFNSSIDYAKDASNYFARAKEQISTYKLRSLKYLIEFINTIAMHDFELAQSALKSYHEFISARHPFERQVELIDMKNIRKIKKFYQETQQILSDLNKDRDEDEPQIID